MMETGKTQKEAALQANIAKTMGSSVMIGEQMVSINAPTKEDKKMTDEAKMLVDGILKKHGLKGLQ